MSRISKTFLLFLTFVYLLAALPSFALPDRSKQDRGKGRPAPVKSWSTACFVTDRCDPQLFDNIGLFNGRKDVLQLSVGALNCGPSANYYRTQGRRKNVNAPVSVGSEVKFQGSLFIPSEWQLLNNTAAEYRRSDIWIETAYQGAISYYPIAGFTNEGSARYRHWSDNGWSDLPQVPINYGKWSPSIKIELERISDTETKLKYEFDQEDDETETSTDSNEVEVEIMIKADEIKSIFVQAYNFGFDYSVYWSNLKFRSSADKSLAFGC